MPPGAQVAQLAIPQPVIERTYVREPGPQGDSVLVKEVFTFQPPQHWMNFLDSRLEVETPTQLAATSEGSQDTEGDRRSVWMVEMEGRHVNGKYGEEEVDKDKNKDTEDKCDDA